MSNLLKRVYTVNKDERVIDYNDLIKKKLEAIMESKHAAVDTDGFVSGLNADVVEELISDDSSEELIQDSGADSDQSAAALENANAEAARIIEDARLQAEQIAHAIIDNCDHTSSPFVEGISSRWAASMRTASASARPAPLNAASRMWWLFSPAN